MKRFFMMTLALFCTVFLARAGQAQEPDAAAGSDIGADARTVRNSPQGNQGFVRMFDGDRYDIGEFDVFTHSGWDNALFNLNLDDIRSGNENGNLDFSWGSAVSLKGNLDILTARTPFLQNGLLVNNQFLPNTTTTDHTNGTTYQDFYKRNFQDQEITLSLPSHPEYRIFAGNWLVQDRGDQPIYYENALYQQSIDRFTRENNAGLDADIGQNGQAYYEYAFRKFVDYAQTPTTIGLAPSAHQQFNIGDQDVNSNKLAFRYNPRANLSVAGAVITRSRENKFNGYTQYDYSGNLSGAYRPSKGLALSARLYESAYQNKTNTAFNFSGVGVGQSPADIDFLFLKADFMARYTGIDNAILTAAYKPEYTRRSGAQNWVQLYGASSYVNGPSIPAGVQYNAPALEDTKQNFEAGISMDLPKNIELEVKEHYLMANRAAYENQPTLSNDPSVTLTVPLPQNVALMGSFADSRSENTRSDLTSFKETKDSAMAGLNWSDAKGRGSIGFFYTFEEGTDSINAWFGPSTAAGNIYQNGAPYNYKNNVISATAMARPVEKLHLTGNVSYTDSEGSFLTNQVFNDAPTWTAVSSNFQAWNPTDLRIVRFGINAKYDLSKLVALSAGYRRQSWIDHIDSYNDGRSDTLNLGVNAKF